MQARRFLAVIAATIGVLAVAPPAMAHNRALVMLPNGDCVQVGSLKSVYPGPDKLTQLDLDPVEPGDEIGTSYAALQGNSALEKGVCPA
jgi:hypothetical protein